MCAAALVVLPWDFRQALIVSLLASLICLSYVVITGFVGQISVVQLALAGVAGYTVSHMAVDFGIEFPLAPLIAVAIATVLGLLVAVSALRVRGVSLAVVTLAAAVAIEKFGFANYRWGGGSGASPVPPPKLGGLSLGPDSSWRGLDGKLPSPVFGFFLLVLIVGALPAHRQRAPIEPRPADAGGALERACGSRGRRERDGRQADRVSGSRRIIAGIAGVMYSYEFGGVAAHEVRRVCGARADRVRVRRRHHDDLRRVHRRPDLDLGARFHMHWTSGSASPATGRCSSRALHSSSR